ncbi:MAG TPA: hypothetical protein VH796_00310 [Nitrososphaeraceae archaeon]
MKEISVLLLVSLTLLSAGVFVDKSRVYALPEGIGHSGLSGPPSLGELPSPGKSSPPSLGELPSPGKCAPPSLGELPSPGKCAPPHNNAENGLPDHNNINPNNIHSNNINPNNIHSNNINPNNIHSNNAQTDAHCTGFGVGINPCNSNKIQDNSNHIEEHCTGFDTSANPCNKHVDPCLVNPCPISPCNINPCHTSDGTVVVGTESTANSYSSSPIIVNGEQSTSTTTNTVNENQETGSSSESIPVADAGSDKNVQSLNHVTLDGSKSYDPDGKKIDYSWVQLAGGPVISLSNDNSVKPTFETPQVTEPTTLTFQLIVNNNNAFSIPSYVTITVKP